MNSLKEYQTEALKSWERKKGCEHCNNDFIVNTKKAGRLPKYCSSRCRVKAYRKRKGLKPEHPLAINDAKTSLKVEEKPLRGLKPIKLIKPIKPNYGADIGTSTIGTGIALGVKELIRPSLTEKQLEKKLKPLYDCLKIISDNQAMLYQLYEEKLKWR